MRRGSPVRAASAPLLLLAAARLASRRTLACCKRKQARGAGAVYRCAGALGSMLSLLRLSRRASMRHTRSFCKACYSSRGMERWIASAAYLLSRAHLSVHMRDLASARRFMHLFLSASLSAAFVPSAHLHFHYPLCLLTSAIYASFLLTFVCSSCAFLNSSDGGGCGRRC